MKTSTVTPSFYYVFNISLYCYDTIPNFIGNLWRFLLPGNHLKLFQFTKQKDHSLFTNYRPISLLSNFSKFFEKVMYNRIIEFAEQYNILYRCQFLNYSTSHALIHLINRISSAIDQRETTVGVFLDLSKAFDTLDHPIYLPSWSTMVSVVWLCSGLKATFLVAGN